MRNWQKPRGLTHYVQCRLYKPCHIILDYNSLRVSWSWFCNTAAWYVTQPVSGAEMKRSMPKIE